MDKWETYFKELLTEKIQHFSETIVEESNENDQTNYIQLDLIGIEIIVNSLKNKKAYGEDEIPAELIKYGSTKLFILLNQLFERCLNGEPVPTAWKTGLLSVIHKKGNRKECQNYRGITVTSIFSRMYGRILKTFVEQEFTTLEIEEQAGFRTGRSTMDHIFSIRQLIEKRITFFNSLYTYYL